MTLIIPNAAEEVFLDAILSTNYTLRLFTNDPTAGLTPAQVEALDETDFTEATFPGYAGAALTGGSWVTTQSDPSVGTYAQQTFTRSSTGAPEVIRGYYVVRTTGGLLRWFEYFPGPLTVEFINDAIAITPTFTLDDDQEATVTAQGVIDQQTLTTVSSALSADGPTDMALNNVPVVAGRIYAVHLHAYASLSAAATWHLTLTVNGAQIGRFGTVTSNASLPVDGTIYWEAPATQATDDFAVAADEASGAETLTLNGTATVPRTLTIIDLGVA